MRRLILLALAATALVVSACGGSGATSAPSTPGAGGVAVTTASSRLGTLLTDGRHRTLYLFEKDPRGTSACSGACASLWPPATTSARRPMASGDVTARLLGTTTRSDGARQLTYAGHPLYYYAGDQRPGDLTGQALDQFGAPWFVLAPSGVAIRR